MLRVDYKSVKRSLPVFATVVNTNTGIKKQYNALWDTGAMRSVITKKVLYELHLTRHDKIQVIGVNSKSVVPLSFVDIELEGAMLFQDCYVAVCDIGSDIDVLLGMDIITKGSFLVDTKQTTVLTFAAN